MLSSNTELKQMQNFKILTNVDQIKVLITWKQSFGEDDWEMQFQILHS